MSEPHADAEPAGLCEPCLDIWRAWLTYQSPSIAGCGGVQEYQQSIGEYREARAKEHWTLVVDQMRLVENSCRLRHREAVCI